MTKMLKMVFSDMSHWSNSHSSQTDSTAHTACVQSSSMSTTYLTVDWLKKPAVLSAPQDHEDEALNMLKQAYTDLMGVTHRPQFFQCCGLWSCFFFFFLLLLSLSLGTRAEIFKSAGYQSLIRKVAKSGEMTGKIKRRDGGQMLVSTVGIQPFCHIASPPGQTDGDLIWLIHLTYNGH